MRTLKEAHNAHASLIAGSVYKFIERKVIVGKLKVTFIVELGQRRRVRVLQLKVHVVAFGIGRCVAALLADVYLVTAFFVRIVVRNAMYLEGVRLERTALRE